MNKINKEDMIEFLKRKIKIAEREENTVINIVNELYDLSKDYILPLDDIETLVFRKRYGILDEGIPQPVDRISNELNLGYKKVQKLLESSMVKLSFRIKKMNSYQKPNRMSSIDLNPNKEQYENIMISSLPFGTSYKNKLIKSFIFTIKDLMKYSLTELKYMLGKKEYSEVVNFIHSLNIEFLDELTDDIRKEIIINTPFSIISNSSVYWIKGTDKIPVEKLKDNYIFDIKSLILNLGLLTRGEQLIIMKDLKELKLGVSINKKSKN